MQQLRQYSLAYLFLEVFWIAVTLALVRQAYWLHFRYRSFFDGWSEPDKAPWFLALVIAALITGSTAVGGLFHRMREGALFAIVGVAFVIVISGFLLPVV